MHIKCTPEGVRTLLAEHKTLEYASATDADVLDAADVLEGIEELVRKLDPSVRRNELLRSSLPVGEYRWIPVIRNCARAAGVAIDPEGATSFMVTGHEFGDDFPTYFSARQAVVHVLLRETETGSEALAELLPEGRPATEGDGIVAALKANGQAVPAGRTVADVDPEVLAMLYPLSEAGEAHLFAEASGIVIATAGSTAGDRRRAVETLAQLSDHAYSSRPFSVFIEAGGHYSEEPWFGHSVIMAPKPKEAELDDAAERFRAARFVRPSKERPLDVAGIQRRVRDLPLVRTAVRHATTVDASDAGETLRRLVALALVARCSSRATVRRALAAERPWDSEAERGRMEAAGRRLRRRIAAGRRARGGKPVEPAPAATPDVERRERFAPPAEDPKLRASVERRRESGRAAYDTARAVYLQRCPGLERKLLHLLRREGTSPESEFVSRRLGLAIGADAQSPEVTIRAALRSLAEAGKVRRLRSAKTGRVFLAATEPLDETGFRQSLNGLVRDRRFGIVNPWAEAGTVETGGEEDEWERGAEDLEAFEAARLAPRRLRSAPAYEQPLPAADLVAEPSAQEEIEAIADEIS